MALNSAPHGNPRVLAELTRIQAFRAVFHKTDTIAVPYDRIVMERARVHNMLSSGVRVKQ